MADKRVNGQINGVSCCGSGRGSRSTWDSHAVLVQRHNDRSGGCGSGGNRYVNMIIALLHDCDACSVQSNAFPETPDDGTEVDGAANSNGLCACVCGVQSRFTTHDNLLSNRKKWAELLPRPHPGQTGPTFCQIFPLQPQPLKNGLQLVA